MRYFLLSLICFSLSAAYIGNPGDPAIMNTGFFSSTGKFFKFTSGYLADYISDKRYTGTDENGIDPNDTFRHFGLYSQMASVSFIFLERLEITGYAGGSKEHMKWCQNPQLNDFISLIDFQSTYHFSWSAAAKVILLQWGQTYFTTEFTYFNVPSSHQSYFKFLNRLNLPLETEKQTFSIREWQVTGGLATRIFFLTPYGGVTYLFSKLNIHAGDGVPPLYYKNEQKFGYFYGFTLSLTGRLHLNFERRMRDEFSYSFATIAVF
ncbi:MAG: hypothetical protein KGJ02_04100 [Verrucomicrobiota bacterium]|nr:hypothetical protein [Verrucomicrobiota bacterium]